MSSYKQIKEFLQSAKGEQIPKNTILVPDWLTWMFHYIDFWTLVSSTIGSYLWSTGNRCIVIFCLFIINVNHWRCHKYVKAHDIRHLQGCCTFWCHLWYNTEQMHGNILILWAENTYMVQTDSYWWLFVYCP